MTTAEHPDPIPEDQQLHRILQAARKVHAALGPGFLETIYSRALVAELKNSGFRVEREKMIKIWYGNLLVGKHCLDLVIDSSVILELKAGRSIIPVHGAQMNSYLHASKYAFGIVLNFGAPVLEWELFDRKSGSSG